MALSFRKSASKWPLKEMAAGFLIAGLLLFCVPMYLMAIKGRREEIKYLIPIGGVSFVAGWLVMIFT
jgi:uncharacterized membrane protein YgdD (TMEM256/DUF423 family)